MYFHKLHGAVSLWIMYELNPLEPGTLWCVKQAGLERQQSSSRGADIVSRSLFVLGKFITTLVFDLLVKPRPLAEQEDWVVWLSSALNAVTHYSSVSPQKTGLLPVDRFDVLRVIYFPFKPEQESTGLKIQFDRTGSEGNYVGSLKLVLFCKQFFNIWDSFQFKKSNCLVCVCNPFPNSAYLLYKWLFKVNAGSIAVYQLKVKLPAVSHSSTAVNSCFAFSSRKHISDFKLALRDFSWSHSQSKPMLLTNRHSNINCTNYVFKLLIDFFFFLYQQIHWPF